MKSNFHAHSAFSGTKQLITFTSVYGQQNFIVILLKCGLGQG